MRDIERFPDFDVVAYHASCNDGLCAAAVASAHCPNAVFVPVQYQRDFPDAVAMGGKRLLFVDFCPEEDEIDELLCVWDDLFIIDHHQGRDWVTELYPDHCYFALDRSGAALAWEWFNGQTRLPAIVRYVQDRDLWQWLLPFSREISAYLWHIRADVHEWRRMLSLHREELWSIAREIGAALIRSDQQQVSAMAGGAFVCKFRGTHFTMVNAPVLPSETCEYLLQRFPDYPIACAFRFLRDGRIRLSFRAREGSECLSLAQKLGGGGHARAAGATVEGYTFFAIYRTNQEVSR